MKIGDLIKVKWLDACQRDYDRRLINTLESGIELLITNITSGKLLKVLNDVVVLEVEHSEGENDSDCIVIPRSWIVSPKKFVDERMK